MFASNSSNMLYDFARSKWGPAFSLDKSDCPASNVATPISDIRHGWHNVRQSPNPVTCLRRGSASAMMIAHSDRLGNSLKTEAFHG